MVSRQSLVPSGLLTSVCPITIVHMTDGNHITSMLFAAPELQEPELEVLAQIDELRRQLRHQLFEPRRWFGSLHRLSLARAIQGSNSIEGYDAALDDAAAVAMGEEPLDTKPRDSTCLAGISRCHDICASARR